MPQLFWSEKIMYYYTVRVFHYLKCFLGCRLTYPPCQDLNGFAGPFVKTVSYIVVVALQRLHGTRWLQPIAPYPFGFPCLSRSSFSTTPFRASMSGFSTRACPRLWQPADQGHALQGVDETSAGKASFNLGCHTFARVIVAQHQHAEPSATRQGIVGKTLSG